MINVLPVDSGGDVRKNIVLALRPPNFKTPVCHLWLNKHGSSPVCPGLNFLPIG